MNYKEKNQPLQQPIVMGSAYLLIEEVRTAVDSYDRKVGVVTSKIEADKWYKSADNRGYFEVDLLRHCP